MKTFWIYLIKVYQKTLSPFLGKNCKFVPSCSQYMIDAIKEFGSFKGIIMGMKRIIRCNPLSKGGFDPVPKKNNEGE